MVALGGLGCHGRCLTWGILDASHDLKNPPCKLVRWQLNSNSETLPGFARDVGEFGCAVAVHLWYSISDGTVSRSTRGPSPGLAW